MMERMAEKTMIMSVFRREGLLMGGILMRYYTKCHRVVFGGILNKKDKEVV